MAVHLTVRATGIHDLRYKAKLLHRDISSSNIMYSRKGNDDWFILNDFDLATKVDDEGRPLGPTSKRRTGTFPFMAPELIEDMHREQLKNGSNKREAVSAIPHCVRFDFVSLFLVCFWSAVQLVANDTPNQAKMEAERYRQHLVGWESGTFEQIAAVKKALLTERTVIREMNFSPLFAHLRPWFLAFHWPLSEGYFGDIVRKHRKRSKQEPVRPITDSFEAYETMHDEVKLERFLEQFDNYDKGVWSMQLEDAESSASEEGDRGG